LITNKPVKNVKNTNIASEIALAGYICISFTGKMLRIKRGGKNDECNEMDRALKQ
jgi:hypothetical protein